MKYDDKSSLNKVVAIAEQHVMKAFKIVNLCSGKQQAGGYSSLTQSFMINGCIIVATIGLIMSARKL